MSPSGSPRRTSTRLLGVPSSQRWRRTRLPTTRHSTRSCAPSDVRATTERRQEMSTWASLMLIAGGLFAGGAATFAWSRVPIWRRMPAQEFIGDFEETLRRTDKVQPALLVAAIVSTAGFALTADGLARVLAFVGAAGFVVTLAASLAILVPLQQRIVATPPAEAKAIDEMRARWFRGHLGRSMLGAASFVAVAVAATL